ncbi:MAG: YdcF family protein, partial [Alphaproteobacteria bacterium]
MHFTHKSTRHPFLRLVMVVGVLLVAWLVGLVRFAGTIPDAPADLSRKGQAIVVLTGGSGRLDEGLKLLSEGHGQRLFVSGVYQGLDVRTLLGLSERGQGNLEQRVAIGTAINTEGNASETADWMREQGYTSLRLVTGSYHMPRSLLEFSFVMPDVEVIAHPVFSDHVKV